MHETYPGSAAEDALPREVTLLLGCARVATTAGEEEAIRDLVAAGVDWTGFAQRAVEHGVTNLVAQTLVRVAPDLVPEDLLEAFRTVLAKGRRRNLVLFDELARLIEGLAAAGVVAIPFKGPILAIRAYGNVGLRSFRDIDFMIRERDLAASLKAMEGMGYARRGPYTPAQFDMIQRIQGQEIIFGAASGTAVEPHTRLTSRKMALDIDHDALWERAGTGLLNGRRMALLAPEDEVLAMAIHGGKEMWWSLKWACDVAMFLRAHPALDWGVAMGRAREQGSLRMLLLAAGLAGRYFGVVVPADVVAAGRADRTIGMMMGRIIANWCLEEPVGAADNAPLSMSLMRLHDRFGQKVRYVARTLFLPGPSLIAAIPLPRRLAFLYVPLRMWHDWIALPIYRLYRAVFLRRTQAVCAMIGTGARAAELLSQINEHAGVVL